MPDIEFVCPYCKETLSAPIEKAGRRGTCEGCRNAVTIPTVPISLPPEPPPLPPTPPPLPPLPKTQKKKPVLSITYNLLHELEWKRFEEVVAKLFEFRGFRTQLTTLGADGGIDILVFKDELKPVAAIQCKAWNVFKVGVKPVRELFGVMAAEQIPTGFFITSGNFTDEALIFGEGKRLHLFNGNTVISLIDKLPDKQKQELYELATKGDYKTPSCSHCGIKMVKRTTQKGANKGSSFWGCPNFPRCKQTMKMSAQVQEEETADSGFMKLSSRALADIKRWNFQHLT